MTRLSMNGYENGALVSFRRYDAPARGTAIMYGIVVARETKRRCLYLHVWCTDGDYKLRTYHGCEPV